jgi:phospholipid/cholesterol/gamma-HCH transport system substrate-binding protein
MHRTVEWRELKVGLTAMGVLTAIVLFVLLFARVGAMHGKTASVYVLTDDAPGVLSGTDVWLAGKKIGQVKDIHFRAVTTDTLQRLAIHAQIYYEQLHYLRKDAWADIRPGGSLVGAPIIWISSGTSSFGALKDGDTLITKSTGAMKPVGDKIEALGTKVSSLTDSTIKVVHMLNGQIGTLGRLAQNGLPRVTAAAGQIADLTRRARTGDGSLAMMTDGTLRARFNHIVAAKDSIMLVMNSGNGNVARLKNDSALFKKVSHLRAELDSLMSLTDSTRTTGALARMRTDSTFRLEMTAARAQLSAIIADIKKHPGRYIRF